MSNIISIDELRKEFLAKNTPKDIKEFVHKQQELLEKYMRECSKLQEKLERLENEQSRRSSILTPSTNDEEMICIQQIQILKERSQTRELDINDVKKLDLLIKNMRLIRSQPTEIPVEANDMSQGELLAIASQQDK